LFLQNLSNLTDEKEKERIRIHLPCAGKRGEQSVASVLLAPFGK
jgi:hypothetical protein